MTDGRNRRKRGVVAALALVMKMAQWSDSRAVGDALTLRRNGRSATDSYGFLGHTLRGSVVTVLIWGRMAVAVGLGEPRLPIADLS